MMARKSLNNRMKLSGKNNLDEAVMLLLDKFGYVIKDAIDIHNKTLNLSGKEKKALFYATFWVLANMFLNNLIIIRDTYSNRYSEYSYSKILNELVSYFNNDQRLKDLIVEICNDTDIESGVLMKTIIALLGTLILGKNIILK